MNSLFETVCSQTNSTQPPISLSKAESTYPIRMSFNFNIQFTFWWLVEALSFPPSQSNRVANVTSCLFDEALC
jgi:hypothetical protein